MAGIQTMAATQTQVVGLVTAFQEIASATKSLKALIDQALSNNSAQSVNWNGLVGSFPQFLDASGNINGVSPAQISNLIGSLASFQGAWWTTNGGNVELMTTPIV